MSHDDPYADGRLYDMEYEDHTEDLGWYVDRARTAPGPVLELGCGTGRLTIPMARAGARVHGVDRAEGMLERLRARLARSSSEVQARVTSARADYLDPDFAPPDQPLGAVLWPFNALHHCPDPEALAAVLARARGWVRPDGLLSLDGYLPDRDLYSRDPNARYEYRTFVDPRDGGMLESWEQGWWDEAARVHHVVYTYRSGDGREWRSHLALRMHELPELRELVRASGWRLDREASDFRGAPLAPGSLKWVALLRPA